MSGMMKTKLSLLKKRARRETKVSKKCVMFDFWWLIDIPTF